MSTSSKPVVKPKPPVVQPGSGNNIVINPNQRLNPILECIRNVGKEFGDIVPDYQTISRSDFIAAVLNIIGYTPNIFTNALSVWVILIAYGFFFYYVIFEHQDPIRELTKMCLINNITVVVAWTVDEAGLYLSTFKQYEHKPPDLIKERVDKDYNTVLRTALTSISRVNKTDVETLRTSLGSFANIARAPSDKLQNLPGFGQVKVKNMKDAFERPFRNNATSTLPSTFIATQRPTQTDGVSSIASLIKSKEKATSASPTSRIAAARSRPRPPRSPSPVWDIELDINDPGSPSSGPPPPPSPRPSSPKWDIELDLNESNEENTQEHEHGVFGKTGLL